MKTTNTVPEPPQEIAKGIYWVGKRYEKELEVNVFLRVFEGNGYKINMLIDPGPTTDFEAISGNIEKVLGPDYKIHFSFINHQDPDVSMNTHYFQRHFPNMQVITTEDTWRLIRFYGLNPERFIAVEKFKSRRISLRTGHKLIFIPTPYCHFRGACALYDETEQVLFSGDLFGGLSDKPDLDADESYWEGMKIFHQIYMPANIALKNAVAMIRRVNAKPKMIAPQHGSIIRSDLVSYFMEKLEKLEVGLDISINNKLLLESYINASNEILNTIQYKVDEKIIREILDTFKSDDSFPEIIVFNNKKQVVGFSVPVEDALQMLIDRLVVGRQAETQTQIKNIILDAFSKWNLPVEHFTIETQGGSETKEEDLIDNEHIDGSETDNTVLEKVDKLNVKKLTDYLIEKGGGEQFSELMLFRTLLKIPPKILQRNKIDTNEDLKN
ncbi:MAG TPA: hypothetical protein EYP36_07940, partial [Calditrichaeota bacterium]|nr:hypothetical protein [Calditrichota bacterium]